MLDIVLFAKVLALAGSDVDGEAIAALHKARSMLAAAKMSFTDVAQSLGKGGTGGSDADLRRRLTAAEKLVVTYLDRIGRYERELDALRAERANRTMQGGSFRRTRAAIEDRLRVVLGDRRLSRLSDREIARRTGVAPQTIGNWRRRLAAEHASARRTVHNGRRRAG
jgi:hypothetical protein